MVGFVLILILAAIVSAGARTVIGALFTLMFGCILLLASCGIG